MTPIQAFKPLALVAILLIHLTAAIILWRGRVDRHRSLSMHVADERVTFIIFGIVSTIYIGLMIAFMYYWFIPTFKLPVVFGVVLAFGLICQFIAAWTRQLEGREAEIHVWFAYTMASMMPVLLGIVLITAQVTMWAMLVAVGAEATMIGLFVVYRVLPRVRRHYLPLQMSYIGLYCLGLLAITYSV